MCQNRTALRGDGLMFVPQTFSVGDLGAIGFLILLEGLLSADNALVLAIMVKHLPEKLQKKALLYGLGGAFVFRFLAIIFATFILNLWWLQLIGAAYLLWLPIKHFLNKAGEHSANPIKQRGFWQTVIAVELTDIAFAVDSVLAAVGTVNAKDKVWVVYLGAILGIILLRFAAGVFIGVLRKFPDLEHLAFLLVGWVAVKLFLFAGHSYERWWETNQSWPHIPFAIPEMPTAVFWGVMTVLIVGGTLYALRHRAPDPLESETDAASPGETVAEVMDEGLMPQEDKDGEKA